MMLKSKPQSPHSATETRKQKLQLVGGLSCLVARAVTVGIQMFWNFEIINWDAIPCMQGKVITVPRQLQSSSLR